MEPTKRPPIGLTPLIFHQENRLNEIYKAIHRFQEAGKEIPKAWIAEMESLESILDIVEEPKQPEATPKDWRILSFKRIKGDTAQAFTYNEQTGYYADSLSSHEVSLGSMLHNSQCVDSGHFAIQSVKRLSDGVVFSIGDKVTVAENSIIAPIKEIRIANGELRISSAEVNHYAFHNYLIHRIKKAKSALFTTHDGKEIFEGDRVWYVDKDSFEVDFYDFANYGNVYDFNLYLDQYHYFSTEEKAKLWAYQHKPSFSFADIQWVCGTKSFIGTDFLIAQLKESLSAKND